MDRTFLKNSRPFYKEDGLNLLRSGGVITMSWGVEMITLIQEGGEDRAMAFNVNGNHFKGTIILSVNGADLYEIRFMQGGEIINDMTLEDVYVDEVIDLIDERIEKIPSYKR